MEKRKKLSLVVIIVLIVIFVVSALFVNAYNRINTLEEKLADENIWKWDRILFMSQQLEKLGVTEETLEETWLYNNGIIYSTDTLTPSFNGNGKAHAFLGTYYDSLAKDIVLRAENYSDEEKSEGISLFSEMNKELISICEKVLEKADDKKAKLALMDYESELYIELQNEISEFCNKYADKISAFYDKIY